MYKIINGEYYIPNIEHTDYIKLVKGLDVVDIDPTFSEYDMVGKIFKCDDPHNIVVKHKSGMKNLYCLVENCKEGMYDENLRAITK